MSASRDLSPTITGATPIEALPAQVSAGLALAKNLERWLMRDVEPSHISSDDMRVYHLDGGILSNLLNEARAVIALTSQASGEG